MPNDVLGTARRIIEKEKFTVHDCVVIFMNPIKNDTIGICDELRISIYNRNGMKITQWILKSQKEQNLNGQGI